MRQCAGSKISFGFRGHICIARRRGAARAFAVHAYCCFQTHFALRQAGPPPVCSGAPQARATAAMEEFSVPSAPEQLWTDSELAFRCEAFADLSEASVEEVGEIAESASLRQLPLLVQLLLRQPGPGGLSGAPLLLHSIPPRQGPPIGGAPAAKGRQCGSATRPSSRRPARCRSLSPFPTSPAVCRPGVCAVRPGPPVYRGAAEL